MILAYIGEEDSIFNVSAQEKFYKDRLHIIKNARHNMFYRINNFQQILDSPRKNTNKVSKK